jgi:hypothetical protein
MKTSLVDRDDVSPAADGDRGNQMILIDDKHAIMSQKDFDALPEYSCSLPTGTFIGKRWRRREPYTSTPTHWFLGEFIEINDPENVGIRWREILIA